MVNIEPLTVIECAQNVPESESIDEYLSVNLLPRAQVIQGDSIYVASKESFHQECDHARRDHVNG
jgi:hypothetical protein